jgi:hypothetical protein
MLSSDDSDDNFSDDYEVEEMILHNIINNNQQDRRHNNAQLNVILYLLVPDDHRNLPHSARREFNHTGALHCIQCNYLGLPNNPMTPIFIKF